MYTVTAGYMRRNLSVLDGRDVAINSDIGTIVLDIDGTLCSLTDSVGSIYHQLLEAHGFNSDKGGLEAAVRRVWSSFRKVYLNTAEHHRTTHEREREVWLEFVRRVLLAANLSYGSDPALVESIYGAFASKAYRRVEAGAEEFLRQAHQRGLRVVAASNNDSRSKSTLRELGIDRYLSHVFVAGDLGWKKPSPHFYTTLAARLGLEPSSILHVGNDKELDVEAAIRQGFAAVLYAPHGSEPMPNVRSFVELGALVGW
jgi:putative hydrolase of the HAD superfamily